MHIESILGIQVGFLKVCMAKTHGATATRLEQGRIRDDCKGEFGCEMLSRQVHPDDGSKDDTVVENSASESTVNGDGGQARDEESGMFISGNKN
ncbi:hypothetical protein PIB30_033246 [Stylosanthes scabra]|uniref:Uncharacterized protein n=1 Tax=Stylosanthes scabra TaxID=79078 RepID=A0ABU6WAV9_9FABA|nr:hypothetical protein [Stylosanthes scabra]